MAKSQHEHNKASIDRRGCKKIGIVVYKDDVDRFHAMRRDSGCGVADFFRDLLSKHQTVPDEIAGFNPPPSCTMPEMGDAQEREQREKGKQSKVATASQEQRMTDILRDTVALFKAKEKNNNPVAVEERDIEDAEFTEL